jgi:hypothetical protein
MNVNTQDGEIREWLDDCLVEDEVDNYDLLLLDGSGAYDVDEDLYEDDIDE